MPTHERRNYATPRLCHYLECGEDWKFCCYLDEPCADHSFNEDMIRRDNLPKDVFGLIHDIAYHHEGRDVADYVRRAHAILKSA